MPRKRARKNKNSLPIKNARRANGTAKIFAPPFRNAGALAYRPAHSGRPCKLRPSFIFQRKNSAGRPPPRFSSRPHSHFPPALPAPNNARLQSPRAARKWNGQNFCAAISQCGGLSIPTGAFRPALQTPAFIYFSTPNSAGRPPPRFPSRPHSHFLPDLSAPNNARLQSPARRANETAKIFTPPFRNAGVLAYLPAHFGQPCKLRPSFIFQRQTPQAVRRRTSRRANIRIFFRIFLRQITQGFKAPARRANGTAKIFAPPFRNAGALAYRPAHSGRPCKLRPSFIFQRQNSAGRPPPRFPPRQHSHFPPALPAPNNARLQNAARTAQCGTMHSNRKANN